MGTYKSGDKMKIKITLTILVVLSLTMGVVFGAQCFITK
jgi:hypothetical protein